MEATGAARAAALGEAMAEDAEAAMAVGQEVA